MESAANTAVGDARLLDLLVASFINERAEACEQMSDMYLVATGDQVVPAPAGLRLMYVEARAGWCQVHGVRRRA